MKNPYKINIAWLSSIVILTLLLLLSSCDSNIFPCCLHLSPIAEKIIIGFLYSSILLLLAELIQFISDQKNYGYLKGDYSRTIITDVLPNNKREENLNQSEKDELTKNFKKALPGSRFVELLYYKKIGQNWRIKLKYLHHGIYEGIAEYHKYWEGNSECTKVKFTFTLNKGNLTTGSGNYKYIERDDYGTYIFQVNENDKNEILVSFKNTIPSGLAEGYEKWKRI